MGQNSSDLSWGKNTKGQKLQYNELNQIKAKKITKYSCIYGLCDKLIVQKEATLLKHWVWDTISLPLLFI